MNRKITLVVLLIIIAVATIAYFAFVRNSTPSQTTGNSSSWSTYTNKKYDYQIKYPADWAVEVDGTAVWQDQVPNPELGSSIVFFGTKTEPFGQTARVLWNIKVFVSPAENPQKLSPREWYIEQSKRHFSYGVEQKFDNLEVTTFKGLPALKVRENTGEGYSLLVAKNSTIYHLALSFEKFGDGEFPSPPEKIFQEMLDSFILSSSSAQSSEMVETDWKIYRNDEYSFEFKYPPTWTVKHWNGSRVFHICDENLAASCGPLPEGVVANFTITVMDNTDGLSLEEYVASPARDSKIVKNTILGGEKALTTVPRNLPRGGYPGEYLWVAKDKFVLMMIAGFQTKTDFYDKYGEILSTFKFF